MISPHYKKIVVSLVFVFALSFAFYFAFNSLSFAQESGGCLSGGTGIGSTCHWELVNGKCTEVNNTTPGQKDSCTPQTFTSCRVPKGIGLNVKVDGNCETKQQCESSGNREAFPDSQQCGTNLQCCVPKGAVLDCSSGGRDAGSAACGGGGNGTGTGGLPGIDLTIQGIFKILYGFACWLWSIAIVLLVIFIIIAGLRFMYAGADPAKFATAKTNFKYVILGSIVVMGTFVIISTVAYNIGVDISFIPFDCSGGGVTSTTHYSCDTTSGACIEDSSGGYTNSDCDNACASGGGTQDYQGVPGYQCYASQLDCQSASEPTCQQCTTTSCTDGINCTAGNVITHLGCVNNVCRQINGAGVDNCSACGGSGGARYYSCDSTQNACVEDPAGDYTDLNACDRACAGDNPTPTPVQFLTCVGGTCQYQGGITGNEQGCVYENQNCEGQ